LRRRLVEMGYSISDERIAAENGRLYPIIKVKLGTGGPLDLLQQEIGPINAVRGDTAVMAYARWRLDVLTSEMEGAGDAMALERREEYIERCRVLEEYLKG